MVFIVVTNADEFVLSAVQQVLDDFQVNSSVSNAARQVASTFLEWAKTADNIGKLKEFCDEIIRNLETVFINTIKCRHTGSVANRDKLWKNSSCCAAPQVIKTSGKILLSLFCPKCLPVHCFTSVSQMYYLDY